MDDILLDTNVIPELVRPKPNTRVLAFLRHAVDPWISSLTVHELVYGAERAPDPSRRAKLLAWSAQIIAEFSNRTVVLDSEVAEKSGRLRALAFAQGRPATVADSVIAASAQALGRRVATRNTKDFEAFGVDVVNPWVD